jgi:hypothetical protein
VVLVITGVLNDTVFFGTLAGSTIWLLIAAFVLAAGVSSTGLTTRVATRLVARARSVWQMAHLVTNQILVASTGLSVTFGQWLILGVPLAVVSAHTAAELVLTLFTRSADRRVPLRVPVAAIAEQVDTPVTGRLSIAQRRAGYSPPSCSPGAQQHCTAWVRLAGRPVRCSGHWTAVRRGCSSSWPVWRRTWSSNPAPHGPRCWCHWSCRRRSRSD